MREIDNDALTRNCGEVDGRFEVIRVIWNTSCSVIKRDNAKGEARPLTRLAVLRNEENRAAWMDGRTFGRRLLDWKSELKKCRIL